MLAGGGHGRAVLNYSYAQSLLHVGNHIRQIQQPGTQQPGRCFIQSLKLAKKPADRGFGVEYALYMMDLTDVYNIGNTGKTALSPGAFEPSKP
jgi:hypothetical protein